MKSFTMDGEAFSYLNTPDRYAIMFAIIPGNAENPIVTPDRHERVDDTGEKHATM